jgi:TRAP-type C4-dicarboxylate transport system permease small subunit
MIWFFIVTNFLLGITGIVLAQKFARYCCRRLGWPTTIDGERDSYPAGILTFLGWGIGLGLGAALTMAVLVPRE